MNIPSIINNEEIAVNCVVNVINKAKEKLGVRLNLFEIANSRNLGGFTAKINVAGLQPPLAFTSQALIVDAIERKWRLTDSLMYVLNYLGTTQDMACLYYYFEAIFSQPTPAYPIPQATVSVFFRLQDTHMAPPDQKVVPHMIFRIEGQMAEHDMRYVSLPADWILAELMMKIKLYKRIEELRIF